MLTGVSRLNTKIPAFVSMSVMPGPAAVVVVWQHCGPSVVLHSVVSRRASGVAAARRTVLTMATRVKIGLIIVWIGCRGGGADGEK